MSKICGVGDNGQRYEITYFDPDEEARKVFGWSETIEGARNFAEAINLHPSMTLPIIRDRRAAS
jgi:hypothetical protein